MPVSSAGPDRQFRAMIDIGTSRFSPTPNVPYSLALFLASPKKKGEKEGRRSARGRFFRESPQGHKWELGALQALPEHPAHDDGRINTEKPPSQPPDGREVNLEGPPRGLACCRPWNRAVRDPLRKPEIRDIGIAVFRANLVFAGATFKVARILAIGNPGSRLQAVVLVDALR